MSMEIITNETIIKELTRFTYKPNNERVDFCIQLFIESIVLDKDVKSYSMAQMDKAIRKYLDDRNINIEAERYFK